LLELGLACNSSYPERASERARERESKRDSEREKEKGGIGVSWGEKSRVRGGVEGVAVDREKGAVVEVEVEVEAAVEVESKCSQVLLD